MNITKVRGTQDKLDLTMQNFVVDHLKTELVHHYNYTEIETPILEPSALICRSLGETTDVVTKEMFQVVASGEEKICLRPEATASATRAYIENGLQDQPWRVFTCGPMFRHERPQKGRWRQFDQFNIELINATSVGHDVELLTMLDRIFSETFKLENYTVAINFLGTKEERAAFKKKLVAFLTKHQSEICETCKERTTKNPLRVLDCKSPVCQKIYDSAPRLTDCLEESSRDEWSRIKEHLGLLSVNFYEDHKLVRGLDYYSGLVFEFVSMNLGAQSSFGGGGRYELASEIGNTAPIPAVGFAVGVGRLMMLVEQNKDKLSMPQKPALHVIVPIEVKQHGIALLLADNLRRHDKCVQVLFESQKLQKMMRKANGLGAHSALILGEDEQKAGTVTIKNMTSGESQTVPQQEAYKAL